MSTLFQVNIRFPRMNQKTLLGLNTTKAKEGSHNIGQGGKNQRQSANGCVSKKNNASRQVTFCAKPGRQCHW